MGSVRLTAAQALVRFLAAQYVERDGVRHRFFGGCFGIFGHGNVGIAEALLAHPELLPYHQARNEQGMVHTAVGYARMRNRLGRSSARARSGPARRTWSPAPRSRPSTGCRCCCCPATCSPATAPTPCSAARGAVCRRRLGQRLLPAGIALLRPDLAARAGDPGGARGDARAHEPGRDRRRHARVSAGRAGRGVRLSGGVLRGAGLARSASGCPTATRWRRRSRRSARRAGR